MQKLGLRENNGNARRLSKSNGVRDVDREASRRSPAMYMNNETPKILQHIDSDNGKLRTTVAESIVTHSSST